MATPGVVCIHSPLLPGHSAPYPFRLTNLSDATVWFTIVPPALTPTLTGGLRLTHRGEGEEEVCAPDVTVSPASGCLSPRGSADVCVSAKLAPNALCGGHTYTGNVMVWVWYAPPPSTRTHSSSHLVGDTGPRPLHSLTVPLSIPTQMPEVRFEQPELCLGLCAVSETRTYTVRLVNDSDACAPWAMSQPDTGDLATDAHRLGSLNRVTLSCEPSEGTLAPLASCDVTVTAMVCVYLRVPMLVDLWLLLLQVVLYLYVCMPLCKCTVCVCACSDVHCDAGRSPPAPLAFGTCCSAVCQVAASHACSFGAKFKQLLPTSTLKTSPSASPTSPYPSCEW